MTETAGPQRTAATIQDGDIVRTDDGRERTVMGHPTGSRGVMGGLIITVRFTDGTTLSVSAGAWLDVERAAR